MENNRKMENNRLLFNATMNP